MWTVGKFVGIVSVALLVGAAPVAQETVADFQGPAAEQLLKQGRISRMESIAMGVTAPRKATIVLGDKTRFGAFKTIDVERPGVSQLSNGIVEVNFQDSWRTEIAAYEIDRMIGLGMVPATVERSYRGETGSMQWWVESEWSEAARRKQNIRPTDTTAWNRENFNMALFDNLIYNADRHLNNILVTKGFELRLIDHSRAFRTLEGLKDAATMTGFSRSLLAGIEKLNRDDLRKRVGKHLNTHQISTVLTRRDIILAQAKKLVAEKGEAILY